ncbi:MAG: hypothetical protein KDD48_02105 [Bdellovibrionales bacterium]|nr:hypothetical protein [Bdellovibrionales bacterium]
MSSENSSEKWLHEFQKFMEADSMSPPKGVRETIFEKVKTDLNPPSWKIFFKLGFVHMIVGSLTLFICPQFNVGQGLGLMKLLMKLGPHICMFGCGVFFLGSSFLVSAFLLRPEEVRVLRKTLLLQLSILGLSSLGVFICMGATIVFNIAFVWIIGSILGGFASLELGWRIRQWLRDEPLFNI